MDCTVVYSERSLSDLHDIAAFIAADNAQAAVTFANRLVDLAESLPTDAGTRPPGQKLEERPRCCARAIFDFLSLEPQPTTSTCCVSGTEPGILILWKYNSLSAAGRTRLSELGLSPPACMPYWQEAEPEAWRITRQGRNFKL